MLVHRDLWTSKDYLGWKSKTKVANHGSFIQRSRTKRAHPTQLQNARPDS